MPMAEKRKRVLIIAYVFPPIAYAGTYRTLRLCKYLTQKKYNVSVLTININSYVTNDFSLLDGISKLVEVYRTKAYDPTLYYHHNLKSKILRKKFGKVVNRLLTLPMQLLNQPDHMVGWIPFAVAKALKIIREKKIEIIYTTSPPHSVQITGYIIKNLIDVKWIADLRDPILDNISSVSLNLWEKQVLKILERKVVEDSDFLITNTETVRKRLAHKYRLKNVECIRNSYDPEDFNNISHQTSDYYTISHIGSLYSSRKINLLINAIKKIKDQGFIEPNLFKVKLIGMVDKSIYEEIKKAHVEEYIELIGLVSHKDAIGMMCNSNALLLIKAFGVNSANQIPGKLFEYIGAGKRIIYIGPKDTEAALIIKEYGYGDLVYNDESMLCEVLAREFKKYKEGKNLKEIVGKEFAKKFSGEQMAEKFIKILKTI